jgi:hypothetical protein
VPTLSRKQINEQPERWHIHYAGVRVGLIQQRSGAPPSSNKWDGIADSIPAAIPASNDTAPPRRLIKPELRSRRHGETYLPSRTEADFEQWRQDAAYHAAKYSGWDRKGERWIQGTVYDFKSYRFVPSA